MKKFYESLREYPAKITNVEKNEIIPLTNEQQELYEKDNNNKNYCKIKDLIIILVYIEVFHIVFII